MAVSGKSVLLTNLDRTTGQVKGSSNERGYNEQWTYYEASAAVGLTLSMWRVPKGARLLRGALQFDALGSTNVTIGDSFDTDRFLAAASVSSAGHVVLNLPYSPPVLTTDASGNLVNVTTEGTGLGYEYTCEKDILVSFGDVSVSGTISGYVAWLKD